MPNRIIKESICTSDDINSLTEKEEIFFYRLIVNCDDYGIMDARLPILKAKCFPLRIDKIKDEDINKWLRSLSKQGLVFLYEAEGKPYLKMTGWEKHQQVRAKRSKHPQPDMENMKAIADDIKCNQSMEDVPENPIQSKSESESESKSNRKQKIKFAEFVSMTNDEFSSLVAKIGEDGAKRCIEILDNYKGSTGKSYKSDYRTILNWVIQRYEEEKSKEGGKKHGAGINKEHTGKDNGDFSLSGGFKMATEDENSTEDEI
jgi:hypothetical protein